MLKGLIQRGIIHRFIPPRSPFDKTNYIENYMPPHLKKHVPQAKWSDPSYNWPPKMLPPTQLRGKALLRSLEDQYVSRIDRCIGDIRTGDLVEATCFYSLTSQQSSTFQGVVISRRRRKTINSSMNILGNVDGVQMEMHLKVHSPLVKEIRLIKQGSGKNRARLNYLRDLTLFKYDAIGKREGKRPSKPTILARAERKRLVEELREQEREELET